MIDVHSHVLPGIDDGTTALDEALDFCRIAHERGTEILVATPHHKPGSYENPREKVLENVGGPAEGARRAGDRAEAGARVRGLRGLGASREDPGGGDPHLRRRGPAHPPRVLVPAVPRRPRGPDLPPAARVHHAGHRPSGADPVLPGGRGPPREARPRRRARPGDDLEPARDVRIEGARADGENAAAAARAHARQRRTRPLLPAAGPGGGARSGPRRWSARMPPAS